MILMYVQNAVVFYVCNVWVYSSSAFQEESCALMSQICFSVDECVSVILNECMNECLFLPLILLCCMVQSVDVKTESCLCCGFIYWYLEQQGFYGFGCMFCWYFFSAQLFSWAVFPSYCSLHNCKVMLVVEYMVLTLYDIVLLFNHRATQMF